jgi:hypothetical protein
MCCLYTAVQAVSDMLKDPSLLPQQQHHTDRVACLQEWLAAAASTQHSQQQLLRQSHKQQQQQKHKEQQLQQHTCTQADVTALLQRLQADVVRCVHADSSYSPFCDMAKSLAGGRQACVGAQATEYHAQHHAIRPCKQLA